MPPQSLTTLSPIRPDRLGELRRRLRFVAYAPGVGRPLLELGTVQYARWLVFSHLPGPDGSGRPWPLNWSYLLFDATYDGDEGQYVRTFADILPLRLTKLFGTCFGFQSSVEEAPGSETRVVPAAAFGRFIDRNRLGDFQFWCARYDSAATVRQALAIERVTRRGERRAATLRHTAAEVQTLALGPPARPPTLREATLGPWKQRLRPGSAVNPLLLAAPLHDGGWERVASVTLGPLPRTHFARVVRLPATMKQDLGHRDPDRLERDYLLFSCDHDGTRESYVSALAEQPGALRQIFANCVGFPGFEHAFDFREWVLDHRLKVQYFVAGVPPRPVDEVRELVADRSLIARYVTRGAAGLTEDRR